MNKEEIKELFNKYGVKDLKEKNGQSECYCCKNTKHKYSLTWTSFLYEYKENYYCYDCLLTILLQQELTDYKEELAKADSMLQSEIFEGKELSSRELLNMLKDYKERNEKAIEYIKEHCEIIRFMEDGKYLDKIGRVDGAKVLEILDKKDKE